MKTRAQVRLAALNAEANRDWELAYKLWLLVEELLPHKQGPYELDRQNTLKRANMCKRRIHHSK